MTNPTQLSKTTAAQPSSANKTKTKAKKKPESFMLLKSSIMIFSIAGTMGGWLIFVNQESPSQPMATESTVTELSTIPEVTLVDINELRQVNQAMPQPSAQRAVVTRTSSSQ
ncbi:hypothetical protein [Psychrobacter sp. FDAARGOS_221]|uniref:hypothetical protein n=1 Tax=Psychrobacter sp. FDAARGOS_221 TaxID=1975705 RepID=UPI00187D45FB|nr:hypothetical protein [Psychrobacter sp. FDAARGOS_221]